MTPGSLHKLMVRMSIAQHVLLQLYLRAQKSFFYFGEALMLPLLNRTYAAKRTWIESKANAAPVRPRPRWKMKSQE